MTYTAPLADMRFALREVAGLQQVAALPGYEHATDDTVDAVLEEAAKLAGNGLAPLNRERRQGGRQAGERRGAHRAGLRRHLQGIRRRRLELAAVRSRVRRPGHAVAACRHGAGDVAGGQHGLRPGAAAEPGRDRRHPSSRLGRAEGRLSAQDDLRRMDRHHEPHRAAGGLGSRPAQEPRGQERRPLPGHRPEDLHHLRRARPDREHRAPGAGAHARCAGRRARHLAVHRAEVPGRRRRQARQAQRPALRVARAQARHPCQPDLRDVRSATTAARSATWSARKAAASPTCSP